MTEDFFDGEDDRSGHLRHVVIQGVVHPAMVSLGGQFRTKVAAMPAVALHVQMDGG